MEEPISDLDPNERMNTNMNKDLLQSKHHVTFSSDVEEYEDNLSESTDDIQYNDEEAINKELDKIIDRCENGSENNIELIGFLRMSLEELYDNNSNSNTNTSDDNEYTTEIEAAEEIDDSISMISVKQNDSPKHQYQMHSDPEMSSGKCQPDGMEIKRSKICLSAATNSLKFAEHNRRKRLDPQRVQKTCRTKSAGHQNQNGQNSATKEGENLLKIHLNVKSCCEFKYLDNNRLPRYNGFFSQYGLSKDQLEHREQHRRKCIENQQKRQREIMKAKQQIADLNELAFQQWLIRKNHEAKPKFKNFYNSTNYNSNSNSNAKLK